MVVFLARYLKRFLVLTPGIILSLVAASQLTPVDTSKLLFGLASLLVYIIIAYWLAPKLVRAWRLRHPAKHPSINISTSDGFDMYPINIGIVANHTDLINSLTESGWTLADAGKPMNWLKSIAFRITKRDYPGAPVKKLYMLGRSQDISFEIRSAGMGVRHNVRLWATSFNAIHPLGQQKANLGKVKSSLADEEIFWVGSMSRDAASDLAKNGYDLKHALKIDADHERDMIVHTLSKANQIKRVDLIRLHESFNPAEHAWNVHAKSDGVMAVCHLSGKTAVVKPTDK